ncbi:uncharacterized protein LOC129756949 [Uranotaenia lowii]|uniref:uncharacterized protein LOC129756949 n=1 Tax=Uranotaenia lowii TaxID=190385 RepID=UPI002478BA85|nr:uncharacterized protein LOC129756949 [Uranotaenia lowii]
MSLKAKLVVAFAVVLSISTVLAFECSNCISEISFRDCHNSPILNGTCNSAQALVSHNRIKEYYPNIANATNSTAVQCLKLEVFNNIYNITTYASGCFWTTVNYCAGWPAQYTVKNCRSCALGDPDSPVCASQTSPTPGGSSTTPIPSSSSTVKPGGSSSTANPGSSSTIKPGSSTAKPGSSTAKPGSGSPSGASLSSWVLLLGAFAVVKRLFA